VIHELSGDGGVGPDEQLADKRISKATKLSRGKRGCGKRPSVGCTMARNRLQGLKPSHFIELFGTTEVVPLQNWVINAVRGRQ
jgi:hypothetical protein